jgi:O-antigen/teichoic acid export membrane protein
VLTLAVIAQGINGTLFWNSQLLFAAHRAGVVTRIYVPSMLLLLVLLVPMVDLWGAEGAALALLTTTIVINLLLTAGALSVLRAPPDPAQA